MKQLQKNIRKAKDIIVWYFIKYNSGYEPNLLQIMVPILGYYRINWVKSMCVHNIIFTEVLF